MGLFDFFQGKKKQNNDKEIVASKNNTKSETIEKYIKQISNLSNQGMPIDQIIVRFFLTIEDFPVDPILNNLSSETIKQNGDELELTGEFPAWSSNGIFIIDDVQASVMLPEEYSIGSIYPNPFNPSTNIEFSIPTQSHVSISVYDIKGVQIASLTNEYYNAGYHSVRWNAHNHASGVYFIKMISKNFNETQKVMLLK